MDVRTGSEYLEHRADDGNRAVPDNAMHTHSINSTSDERNDTSADHGTAHAAPDSRPIYLQPGATGWTYDVVFHRFCAGIQATWCAILEPHLQ